MFYTDMIKVIKFSQGVDIGYVVYDVHFDRCVLNICKWYLYPVFRLKPFLRNKKYGFYYYLYSKGLYLCEPGEIMTWRNIKWFK